MKRCGALTTCLFFTSLPVPSSDPDEEPVDDEDFDHYAELVGYMGVEELCQFGSIRIE